MKGWGFKPPRLNRKRTKLTKFTIIRSVKAFNFGAIAGVLQNRDLDLSDIS